MLVLPPEIVITIINALTCNTQLGAYTYTSSVKKTLCILALVNHACYQWSTRLLYSHVTVAGDQITQLVDTLSGDTPHVQSLARRINSLHLVVIYAGWRIKDQLVNAISVLRILAPTRALQRLFMDADILLIHPRGPIEDMLCHVISSPELSSLNQEHQASEFFGDVVLVDHQYDCLLGLQVLTMRDVSIDDPGATDFLLPFVNLKALVLIRPWANEENTNIGSILAGLFAPHRALQKLVLVLLEGWADLGLKCLTAEDLGPAMGPHLDKVDIFSKNEPGDPPSWRDIVDMITMGHGWSGQT
ncbi:hypothetical protein FRB94_012095 [Tulasnella sp. JGI-2019a]|nr:hypothetical protein FRB93_003328 [Tulasnella sp. JGI-2019a]KAG8992008.1 hypothetical protein FRB94_012095 [Tulasnella sp. JGI-2019a]